MTTDHVLSGREKARMARMSFRGIREKPFKFDVPVEHILVGHSGGPQERCPLCAVQAGRHVAKGRVVDQVADDVLLAVQGLNLSIHLPQAFFQNGFQAVTR
jgi:hypothetical protein